MYLFRDGRIVEYHSVPPTIKHSPIPSSHRNTRKRSGIVKLFSVYFLKCPATHYINILL